MLKKWITASALVMGAMGAMAQSNESLQIRSLEVIAGAPTSSFTGEARNTAGRVIKEAVIQFNLYDAQGNLVGNAETRASNIEPDGVWKFQSSPKVPFTTVKAFDVKAY
ncbi:FxLYD domain-containing protein [Aquabacterium sp.]|uniref:FxLYD domain-containing protein n=1 Tax=Aquabacterium sp. TaxID=1872578 RepID=UPI00272C9CAA|nr:FxLYD domain-containing protein [Aquabacterium sp.]